MWKEVSVETKPPSMVWYGMSWKEKRKETKKKVYILFSSKQDVKHEDAGQILSGR